MASFGEALRRLREAAGMTQAELAARTGLSRDAVSALERGHRRQPHSETVRALAAGLGLSDAATRTLRAAARSAATVAPPQAAAESRPAPLPAPPTRLVGRRRELSDLRHLLTDGGARLVTLTGPGGVGKTRLALELARSLESAFAGGVVFVSLATVQDPSLMLPTIAEALGVREANGRSLAVRLAQTLRERRPLLVLDNLEHLIWAASPVAELLAACPDLTILATSRAALRLSGEHWYP
ncbi:MAG TPA: helix-turn-helix domain-containing protein, partial [Thermomicrobiales bacterium]|nr:helix-turn-helix domain-containing protein [Thermomicrobiales bacterium]